MMVICLLSNELNGQSVKGEDFEKLILGDWKFVEASLNNYEGPIPRRMILPVTRYMPGGDWAELMSSFDGDSIVNLGKWMFYPDTQVIIVQRYVDYSKNGKGNALPSGHYERFKITTLTNDSLVYSSMHKDGLLKFVYSKHNTN